MVGHQYPRRRRQDRTRFPSYSFLTSYFSRIHPYFPYFGVIKEEDFFLLFSSPWFPLCTYLYYRWSQLKIITWPWPARRRWCFEEIFLLQAGNYLNSKSRLFSLLFFFLVSSNKYGGRSFDLKKKVWSIKKKVVRRSIGFVYYSFVSSLYTQTDLETPFSDNTACLVCAVSVCRERAVARVIFPAWSCRIFLPPPHRNPQTIMKSLTAFVCFVVLPGELSPRFLAAKRRRIQFHSSI